MNETTDTQQSDKAFQARRRKKGKRKSVASDDEAASGDAKASPSEKVKRFRIPTSQGAMRYPRAPDRSAQSSAPAASSIPPIPGLASEPSTSVKPPDSPASSGPKSPNTPLTQASPDGDGSPGLVDTHFKFEFSCAEAHAKARHVADPLGALMPKIEKISDINQFKMLMHSESLFDGFEERDDDMRPYNRNCNPLWKTRALTGIRVTIRIWFTGICVQSQWPKGLKHSLRVKVGTRGHSAGDQSNRRVL